MRRSCTSAICNSRTATGVLTASSTNLNFPSSCVSANSTACTATPVVTSSSSLFTPSATAPQTQILFKNSGVIGTFASTETFASPSPLLTSSPQEKFSSHVTAVVPTVTVAARLSSSSSRLPSSPSSAIIAQQRRGLSFNVKCESKVFHVEPPRFIPNREERKMHPMVRKFVDSVLDSEPTSLVYNETLKRAEREDGGPPKTLPAPMPAEAAATPPKEAAEEAEEGGHSHSHSKKSKSKKKMTSKYGAFDESIELSDAVAGNLKTGNLMLSGMEGTGKRTNLIMAGEELERHGKRVAWISGDFFRIHSLGASYMHYFFGLRVGDGLPIMEQMVGMFRRHAIILETTFEKLIPSMLSADVLIFDSIQHCTANILKAMDKVCREIRQQPNLPFGGLRILAGANFWRLLRVTPASDYSGYIFQMPEMEKWFDHFYLTNVHHQKEPMLKVLTHKATLGELTLQDCRQLEQLSCAAKSHPMPPTPMVDYGPASRVLVPTMGKHATKRFLPPKFPHLRKTDFGSFLANILGGPSTYSNTYMLPERTTFEPGTPVHLVFATDSVPAGEHGVIESVGDATIVVNFPRLRQSVPIPLARFKYWHADYPEVSVTSVQFPLQNRTVTSGKFLVHGERYWNVQIDGLYLTETNHLGLFLNKMRTFKDFQATNMDKYLRLEGMVHEATRVFYRELMATGRSDTQIVMKGDEWCRNCKSHVPAESFFTHWKTCLKQLRWCADCNRSIPLSKYAAHREKHQIVLCVDCASPVEWRNWELHRLTCGPMMREISAENELLPERTRQVAMQYGLDKRDLHTVKRILKSNLPNAKVVRRASGSGRSLKSKALQEVHQPSERKSDLASLRPV